MKLLGWVHRKFRQSCVDSGRDFSTAGSSCSCLAGCPSPDGLRHPTLPPETARVHQVMMLPEIEPPAGSIPTMLFDGLLTIGTFGSPIFTEALADASDEETAGADAKEIAEKETDTATESELTTIMVELERLLGPESKKERAAAVDRKSSSTVSARASQAGKCSDACPLQDFLFGSPVDVAATAAAAERRASLGELFMRSRGGEEAAYTGGWKRDELNPAAEMSVGTKRMFNDRESAKGGGGGGGGAGKCRGAEMKFQNFMRIFHRKIHPENFTASKNKLNKKAAKHKIKKDKYCCAISKSNKNSKSDYGGRSVPEKADERDESFKCHTLLQLQPSDLTKNNSKGNGEHWIKTDADYLVLEL